MRFLFCRGMLKIDIKNTSLFQIDSGPALINMIDMLSEAQITRPNMTRVGSCTLKYNI